MIILGIETSCDETGIGIYDSSEQRLLAHFVHSQIEVHAQYGGVVPELASRDHIKYTLPLIEKTLEQASLDKSNLDAIAYTGGPGLIGALLVGTSIAHALGLALNIPVIKVHHMEGHLLSPLMENNNISPPFIALLVSGGHTMLVHVKKIGDYELLGETLDDAVGEAFDKTAKLLGLSYPGGPAIAKLATKGNPTRFSFPRPMTNRPGLDFSFSGLKTFTRQLWEKHKEEFDVSKDIAAGFQTAVVDTLIIKCRRAISETKSKQLIVSGGVGANLMLREKLYETGKKNNFDVFFPSLELCTDNGAMIAFAAAQRFSQENFATNAIHVHPKWSLTTI